MIAQMAESITFVVFAIISLLLVGRAMYPRVRSLMRHRDPALIAYLASRGYTSPPSIDPMPNTLRLLYPNTVFGTCGDIAFAFVITIYRSEPTIAIYAASDRARPGAWYCVPRAQPDWSARPITFFGLGQAPTLSTRDESFDALVDTFGEGSGPSPEVRARVLAFPGGVRSAGWYQGRAIVSLSTRQNEYDPVRLDAAFDLVRALMS